MLEAREARAIACPDCGTQVAAHFLICPGCHRLVHAPMAHPLVRYAATADGLEIAYQVWGDGAFDVVIIPGLTSNVDRNPDYPIYGGYLRRFPRFARTIVLDRRGGGISDREVGGGSAEDRMDDVRAVMDAVGCKRAALLGHVDGGAIAILFAATYPDRASALVLIETPARALTAPDYPMGLSAAAVQEMEQGRLSVGTGTGQCCSSPLTGPRISRQRCCSRSLARRGIPCLAK